MGYQHRILRAFCGRCDHPVYWKWEEWGRPRSRLRPWDCSVCGAANVPAAYHPWPHVPRVLYAGQDRGHQLKLYPVPPDHQEEPWAQPYSTRSFVAQASERLQGCWYTCSLRKEIMGEPVFDDRCHWLDDNWEGLGRRCHMIEGWTLGEESCPLWQEVGKFCQTDTERRFLHWYLGLVKDRQFPMLIPQVRAGIAERRRPDFVLFVPLQYWNYKWYAVQLDRAHAEEMAEADELRDADIAVQGYTVIRLKPGEVGYYEEVRRLVERIEREMEQAASDPLSVAVRVGVESTEPHEGEEEPPF